MLTQTINIHEAKTYFEIKKTPRQPGLWRGKVIIKKGFDKLPKHLMAAFI